MGKRDREKKDVKRLRLRREVIRVLASDSLLRVYGGMACTTTKAGGSDNTDTGSVCVPSK
jgi:hypothetical protein